MTLVVQKYDLLVRTTPTVFHLTARRAEGSKKKKKKEDPGERFFASQSSAVRK